MEKLAEEAPGGMTADDKAAVIPQVASHSATPTVRTVALRERRGKRGKRA
jgi:hypothetical protein